MTLKLPSLINQASPGTSTGVAACLAAGVLMSSAVPASAGCASVVCLNLNPNQSVLFGANPNKTRISSTGVYAPVDVWNMGGGDFDIAFLLPISPVAVMAAQANNPPINLTTVLDAPAGAYLGNPNWSYVVNLKPLPVATLNVTAYEVHAGPNYVGIQDETAGPINTNINTKTFADVGFAVQVPAANLPAGNVHWVQVIADNYNISDNPGYGNAENIIDNLGNAAPYYDVEGAANSTNFFDSPIRDNEANLNESDWWLADLFLATGPAGNKPGQVVLYNSGVQYGWGNFHISVGALGLGGLRNLFALDTSSVDKFDTAIDCPLADCPLNSVVTTSYLNALDQSFLAAVPEPGTWAMMMIGVVGVGGVMRARRRRVAPAWS